MGTKLKKLIIFLGDIFLLYLSLFLSLFFRFSSKFRFEVFELHLLPFSLLYFFWLIIFYVFGLFDLFPIKETLSNFFLALFLNFTIGIFFFYFVPFFKISPKTILILDIVFFAIFSLLWHSIFYFLFSIRFLKKIAILGKGVDVEKLKEEIQKNKFLGFKLVPENKDPEIIIFSKEDSISKPEDFFQKGIDFWSLDEAFEKILEKIPVRTISTTWFLENLREGEKKIYEKLKRIFDLILASLFLILTLPFWPIIALAIKIEDGGPIFYLQERVGKNKKIFKLIKFRSMIPEAEKEGAKWADVEDKRVTKVGKFLRRLHLDEIPQMINVLKGDISLVGPRPERPEFVEKLEKEIPHYNLRHIIKPGFTGWAQIKFRYARSIIDSFEKFQYDLYYIKNRNFILDLKILLKTFQLLFKKE